MNIIYGLIGNHTTAGRTKEVLIEDLVEVQGNFSNKVYDRSYENKLVYPGYKRFDTKLIRSTDHHGINYAVRLSNKVKLVLNHRMDMHPKHYSSEVERNYDPTGSNPEVDENTLLITMSNHRFGNHAEQDFDSCECYLKFLDRKSFQKWQRQLGEILAEIKCWHAMKPLPSGMNSLDVLHFVYLS